MNKHIYVIQPTYRAMDGTVLKEMPLFNYSYNLPILSATIPSDWEKTFCLEYCDDIDYSHQASVVLITSTGYDIGHAAKIAQEFRRRGKYVIFGAHMDDLSDRLMREYSDAVFYGYPNHAHMQSMLNDALGNSLQTEYKFGINIDYPFDYSVLNGKNMWFIPALASVGCKNTCSYCCYTPIFNGTYRLRHIDNVISDMKQAAKLRRPIAFLDANLFNNKEYIIRLANRIIEEKLNVRWGGQATIDVADDPNVLRLLRKAGCRMLFFGLESLDHQNMAQLNKPYDPDLYEKQVGELHRAGIMVGAFFMLGMDNDTPSMFNRVYDFYKKTNVDVPYIHILFPVPGTPLADSIRSSNRLHEVVFDQYSIEEPPQFSVPCSNACFVPKNFTEEELEAQYLALYKRLVSWPNILQRTIRWDIIDAGIIFGMNLESRRKYNAMVKAHKTRTKSSAPNKQLIHIPIIDLQRKVVSETSAV